MALNPPSKQQLQSEKRMKHCCVSKRTLGNSTSSFIGSNEREAFGSMPAVPDLAGSFYNPLSAGMDKVTWSAAS